MLIVLNKFLRFSSASIGTTFLALLFASTSIATALTPKPTYDRTANYKTQIPNKYGTVDEADIYYPVLSQKSSEILPVALFLQGAFIDKSNYSDYAQIISSYGFVVVVPNRRRFIPQFDSKVLAPEISQINDVLTYIINENQKLASPINNALKTDKLILLGHSIGGTIGLRAIINSCLDTSCPIAGGAFFGSNLRDSSNNFIPIKNHKIPIILLKGTLDGTTLPGSERKTYDFIENAPKALITIQGANHYAITNEDDLDRRRNIPTLKQKIATETIARWSALFLRATVLDDLTAYNYVFKTGDCQDKNVTVINKK